MVTVHDLSFFDEPRWHERSKVLLFRRAITVAARRAAAVVCPSRVTAEQLARWCRVEAEVFVAPHGVDTRRFRPDEPDPGADAAALARLDPRLAAGRPYLVFVGTLEPRKDVPTLVAAFARIAGRHPEALLVLAGGPGGVPTRSTGPSRPRGCAPRIVRTGYVPDAVVPALLRSAAAAVYPALYEGFGLPALEALACGVAVDHHVGDGHGGGGGGRVRAGRTRVTCAGLADALDARLARSPEATGSEEDRRRRGFDIVSGHTWAASAERHLEAYRSAAGRPGRRRG